MKTLILLLAFWLALPAQSATYYVATLWGNDANAGTSKTAAVKTLNYALNTLASGGDTIIVSPEYGITECINLTKSFTADSKVTIFGDCLNTNGFTNLQGVAVSPNIVWWNNYTSGLLSPPTNDDLLDMNGRSNIVLHSLWLGLNAVGAFSAIKATSNSRKLYLTNCTISCQSFHAINFDQSNPDGFYFFADSTKVISKSGAYAANMIFAGVSGSDWDAQIATKNCIFFTVDQYNGVNFSKSGSAGGVMGGWKSTNDLFLGGIRFNGTSTNTLPCIYDNSLWSKMISGGVQHTGQVIFARSVLNGASGAHGNIHLGNSALKIETNNYAILFNYGYLAKVGLGLGDWFSPLPVAPYIGMGSTNAVLTDMYGRLRPQPVTPGPLEVQYNFQRRNAR